MWPGSISARYRRRLVTNSSRNPPSAARVLPDGVIMGVDGAPGSARPVARRAPQIALSPAEWTRGSSLISPSSTPSKMDSPGLANEIGKRARLRPVPSPSLQEGPLGWLGGNAPAQLAGANWEQWGK